MVAGRKAGFEPYDPQNFLFRVVMCDSFSCSTIQTIAISQRMLSILSIQGFASFFRLLPCARLNQIFVSPCDELVHECLRLGWEEVIFEHAIDVGLLFPKVYRLLIILIPFV